MTRFHFALARVLRVRQIEQDLARSAWSAAEREARAAREVVAGLTSRIDAEQRALCAEQGAGLWNPSDILRRFACLDQLRRGLAGATLVVAERETLAERARSEWQTRRSDERGIERLEQRQRAAHGREAERVDNALLDEQASMRAARRPTARRSTSADSTTTHAKPRSAASSRPVNEA